METIYFRRKSKKPFIGENRGAGTVGTITFKNNLLCIENNGVIYYDGYEVIIWDKRNDFHDRSGNEKLDTLEKAKEWIKNEYGGTWIFSEDPKKLKIF